VRRKDQVQESTPLPHNALRASELVYVVFKLLYNFVVVLLNGGGKG